MCYFFINILKIAMSAKRSVIIHKTSAFVIRLEEVALYYFCWWVQSLVLSRSTGCPRNAIDTHITGF